MSPGTVCVKRVWRAGGTKAKKPETKAEAVKPEGTVSSSDFSDFFSRYARVARVACSPEQAGG
jgi:hypothetical protein